MAVAVGMGVGVSGGSVAVGMGVGVSGGSVAVGMGVGISGGSVAMGAGVSGGGGNKLDVGVGGDELQEAVKIVTAKRAAASLTDKYFILCPPFLQVTQETSYKIDMAATYLLILRI